MERWEVNLTKEAETDLNRLDRRVRDRTVKRLTWLGVHFEETVPLPLGGPWRGFFKFRLGDWRVIYTIEWQKSSLTIHLIDHRDKVYKRRKL